MMIRAAAAAIVKFILSMMIMTLEIAWKTLVVLVIVQWLLNYYPIGIYHP
jgi:hypothetical protein